MRYLFFLCLSVYIINMSASLAMDNIDSDDDLYTNTTPLPTKSAKLELTQGYPANPFKLVTSDNRELEGDFCFLRSPEIPGVSPCFAIAHNYRPSKEQSSFLSSIFVGLFSSAAYPFARSEEREILTNLQREHARNVPRVLNVNHAYLGSLQGIPGARFLISGDREISVLPEGWTSMWSAHRTFIACLDNKNEYYQFYNPESKTYLGVLKEFKEGRPFLAGLEDPKDITTRFCLAPSTAASSPPEQGDPPIRIYANKIE